MYCFVYNCIFRPLPDYNKSDGWELWCGQGKSSFWNSIHLSAPRGEFLGLCWPHMALECPNFLKRDASPSRCPAGKLIVSFLWINWGPKKPGAWNPGAGEAGCLSSRRQSEFTLSLPPCSIWALAVGLMRMSTTLRVGPSYSVRELTC